MKDSRKYSAPQLEIMQLVMLREILSGSNETRINDLVEVEQQW